MEKEKIIKILMCDNCTKKEAEKHIQAGTIIYTEEEKNVFIDNCVAGMFAEEEALEMWEKLRSVLFEGVRYYIDYAL